MYKIINCNGCVAVGKTEKPRYIRKKDTGVFVQTDEKQAQGIAFKDVPYNLSGREGVGAEETVFLIEFDGGDEMDETQAQVAANSAAIDDLTVAMLEG